jgi:hypothetical protein
MPPKMMGITNNLESKLNLFFIFLFYNALKINHLLEGISLNNRQLQPYFFAAVFSTASKSLLIF